ncbi:MAG: TonB-dependent receptor, partial [Acidobacteriaceae bacterium]|nr:TonB-dependent receptor [Acidobacteriaceae bacterium]
SYNQGFFSTSGSQVVSNETLIDGVPANAALYNAPAFVPVVDDVDEFKVQTNTVPAEFGRTGGGIVNLVTKSGGNQVHGTAYDFFRNDLLNANNWFNNRSGTPRPATTTNQFGFTIGGPVVLPHFYDGHNKTFWFFNYEGLRDRLALTQTFTIPTPQELQGDFSHLFTSSGQFVRIYDPTTTRPDPAHAGAYIRDAFQGNIIPARLINAVSAKIAALYPAPNTTGNPLTGANNFIGSAAVPNTQDQFTARIDHTIRERHHLFGRFSYSNVQRGAYDFFHNGGGWVNPGGGGVPLGFNARNFAFDYTDAISPTLLFEFSYGFVRQFVGKKPAGYGIDLTTLGFPTSFARQIPVDALPSFQPSGYRAIAPQSQDLINRGDNTHTWQGSMTKVLTNHTLKWGGDYRFIPIGELQPNSPQGTFNFDAGFTGQNPLATSATSGNSIASFLLGYPSSGNIDNTPAISISYRYFGAYLQDDYRVSPKLTLNLGLRYEVETGRNERYNRLSWFDPSVLNPIGPQVGIPNLTGGLRFVGVNGDPTRQKATNWNRWGPRFGLAYNVLPSTVIRAGYAIFYLPATGDDQGTNLGGSGFFATTPYVASLNGNLTPAGTLSNPFPQGIVQPTGSSLGLRTLLGQDIVSVYHNDRSAYSQQWNFDVQHQLRGNVLFDLAYAGSKGTALPVDIQLDQLPDQYLSLGPALLQQVPNPFFGVIATGPLTQPVVARGVLLRPFPEFNSVNIRAVHEGNSIYHSMQVKVERRFRNGFSLLGAYTWSKMITDAGSRLSINFANPGLQDSNNLRAERSLANIDVPQRFVLSYNWQLPFGSGKLFLTGGGTFTQKIVSGWEVNGITTIQNGLPLGLTTSINQTNSLGGGSRPSNNGHSAALSGSVENRLNQYFNTTVFSQPPAFTFGNTSRTLPDVRAPGLINFDFSAIKNTRFYERYNLQFRAEFFNVLNRVNFGGPGTTFGTSTFGVINSAGDPRISQLALKLIF